jgi:hypothetical protein
VNETLKSMAESEDDEDALLPVVRQLDLMVLLVFSFISSVRLTGPHLFFGSCRTFLIETNLLKKLW